MTQSTTQDPWAAASMRTAPAASQQAPTQGEQMPQQDGQGGNLGGAFAPAGGGTALFSQGSVAPSLFNKTHPLGTVRKGVISKAPYEQQSRDFNSKLPKYWSFSRCGGEQKNRAVTTDEIDPPTGKHNRPVMDTMVELDTEYGPLSEQEMIAVGRQPGQEGDGKRVFAVSGKDTLEKFRAAIFAFNETAKANGQPLLTCEEDLVGLTLFVKRSGQKPNPNGQPSWVHEIHLSRS